MRVVMVGLLAFVATITSRRGRTCSRRCRSSGSSTCRWNDPANWIVLDF